MHLFRPSLKLAFALPLPGLAWPGLAWPGPRHALCGQFDALCVAASVTPRLRQGVDDMAMPRLVARYSGWLAVLPEEVGQNELRTGLLVTVGRSTGVAGALVRDHHIAPGSYRAVAAVAGRCARVRERECRRSAYANRSCELGPSRRRSRLKKCAPWRFRRRVVTVSFEPWRTP